MLNLEQVHNYNSFEIFKYLWDNEKIIENYFLQFSILEDQKNLEFALQFLKEFLSMT